MNYLKILKADIANGIGFRTTLFVSGCLRHCKGCFNKCSWDADAGRLFDEDAYRKLTKELNHEYCRGLSLLGGEPFSILSDNREATLALVRRVKEEYPDKSIWCWTGYTIEELMSIDVCREALKYIDVLIDGPFVEELKDTTLKWKGSSNQRVIDVNKYISNEQNYII